MCDVRSRPLRCPPSKCVLMASECPPSKGGPTIVLKGSEPRRERQIEDRQNGDGLKEIVSGEELYEQWDSRS